VDARALDYPAEGFSGGVSAEGSALALLRRWPRYLQYNMYTKIALDLNLIGHVFVVLCSQDIRSKCKATKAYRAQSELRV